ncbi:MAG: IS1595 family transposase [Candidatus Hydrogenedentes bacterium]|nr:IS1595 family transposase [Candidatus Hydrogenedentota bacterium]
MSTENFTPQTLIQAMRYFSNAEVCDSFVASLRWPDGVECPHCQSKAIGRIASRRMYQCKTCRKQFSVKRGTIFEDSPIALEKWLAAMWLVANCKNGVSSYEVARDLGVTQKSAWFMLHRIRLAMQDESFQKLTGIVEVDETLIGGKARFMHKKKKAKLKKGGRGSSGKVIVMGALSRTEGKVRTRVIESVKRSKLDPEVRKHVEKGSEIHTDALASYESLADEYDHKVIDHAIRYVDGNIHTNCMENFWSCLKRSIKGTYVSVEPFHLFRYLDEQAHRFNNRKLNDAERFQSVVSTVAGKRLTYAKLTGETPKAIH